MFSEVAMPLLPFARLHLPLTLWLAPLRLLWYAVTPGAWNQCSMPGSAQRAADN